MDKYIGQLLDDRYELLEVIGIGGMAVVYKARCHRLNRLVAVKILKDDYQQDDEFRRRFQAESQAIAMLSHANIVSVYDISSGGDLDYIVMELIDGMTLKDYVTQRGEISWRETLHFSTQIAKALDHAHSRGVIHRDIKPHNIMVLKDGSVKVADFGIAQLASTRNTLTREALGSVHYISPEQARGSGTDQRTDLYSLGVVMYELLTGQLPYDGETPVAVAIQHINGGAKAPRELKPSIPVGLEQIVQKAMEPELDRRYASAAQMTEDLEAFRKDPNMTFAYGKAGLAMAKAQKARTNRVEQAILHQKQSARTVTASSPQQTSSQPAPAAKPAQTSGSDRPGKTQSGGKTAAAAQGTKAQKPQKPATVGKPVETKPEAADRGPSMVAILIGTVCVLLILAGIGYFLFQYALRDLFFSTAEVEVPSFLGMTEDTIDPQDYPGLELVIGARSYSDQPEGTVIAQSPEQGKAVKEGNNTVTLTISQGVHREILPDLTGDTQQDAELMLTSLNLDLDLQVTEEYDPDLAEGRVIRTLPEAQTELQSGDTVTLVVSLGRQVRMLTVPQLSDGSYTLEQATAALEELGLGLSHAVETDSDQPEGTVVDQSLAAGSSVREDTRITLYVSGGPLTARDETTPEEPEEEAEELSEPERTEEEAEVTDELPEPEPVEEEPQEEAAQSEPEETQETQEPEASDEGLQPSLASELPAREEETDPEQESEPRDLPGQAEQPADTQTPVNLDEPSTQTVTVDLPETTGMVVVTLKLDGVQVGRYAVSSGDETLTCQVTGTGQQRLDIYFDGVLTQTQTVNFSEGG